MNNIHSFVCSRTRSPLSAQFSPDIVKEPSVKLSSRVAKDKVIPHETIREVETSGRNAEISDNTDSGEKLTPHELLKDASPSEMEEILENQKKEEALLEEQHELLQKKLLHDYDNYVSELGSSQQKKLDVEIVNGTVTLMNDAEKSWESVQQAQESRKTVQASPVGTYDLSTSDVIPSYSIMYSPGESLLGLEVKFGLFEFVL